MRPRVPVSVNLLTGLDPYRSLASGNGPDRGGWAGRGPGNRLPRSLRMVHRWCTILVETTPLSEASVGTGETRFHLAQGKSRSRRRAPMKDQDVNTGREVGAPVGSTSSSLLARARSQAPGAWERLADLYCPLVYGWARRAGLRAEDAADVVQDVFRAVLAHLSSFRRERSGDTFRGWLWTITRNKVRDLQRRQSGQPLAAG